MHAAMKIICCLFCVRACTHVCSHKVDITKSVHTANFFFTLKSSVKSLIFCKELYWKMIWRKKPNAIFTRYCQMSVAQCGNFENSLSNIFGKKFVKTTVLLKKLLTDDLTKYFLVRVEICTYVAKILCQTFLTKISWK